MVVRTLLTLFFFFFPFVGFADEFNRATVDGCGVAGGDGTSCLGCTSVSTEAISTELDGNAVIIYNSAKRLASRLLLLTNGNLDSETQATVNALSGHYMAAWSDAWTLPENFLTCQVAASYCAEVSHASKLSHYREMLDTLLLSVEDFARALVRSKRRLLARTLRRRSRVAHQNSVLLLASLPSSTTLCLN